ncbi:MAG TPA: hypothetical protein VN514_08000 [Ignavibacteria bacterium]|nr:hypothetical protein [Ignavibacteria bacterium]
MKKFLIILSALVLAFYASEFILHNILKYPKRTASVKYAFISGIPGFEVLKLKEPHSDFWSVEGGNKVYKYNNLSVTGIDMYPDEKSKLIYVLGNSYVEAASVPPESTGVSVLQKHLNTIDTNIKVFNAAYPNSDPYTLWFRTLFFEKWYKPDYVFLLLTRLDLLDLNLQKHKDTLDFRTPENFGNVLPESKSDRYLDVLRKRFAVFNLISQSISTAGVKNERINSNIDDVYVKDIEKSMEKLKKCLIKFREKFGDRFTVISLETDEAKSRIMADVCESVGVVYANKKLLVSENQWEKGQHLNEKGNREFGDFLFELFKNLYLNPETGKLNSQN